LSDKNGYENSILSFEVPGFAYEILGKNERFL
jgi:hypothetical protein